MKKIVTVLGARPQFIKASAVSHAMAELTTLNEVVVHTGQHFDANMSDVFFAELGMAKPAYFLDIHDGSHGAMTGRMLADVEQVLLQEKPDAVLVSDWNRRQCNTVSRERGDRSGQSCKGVGAIAPGVIPSMLFRKDFF